MTPTNKLRFVERQQFYYSNYSNPSDGTLTARIVRVLQQWWEDKRVQLSVLLTDTDGNTVAPPNVGEWRDVPLEKEND